MPIVLTNLAGLWALLGIPAILLIHLLQRRAAPLLINTLFLLESLERESRSGHRVQRIRSSLPLWLQLLAVLVLTWLLVEPRWMRSEQISQHVIVLDSSASMAAFAKERRAGLERMIQGRLDLPGDHLFTILESHQSGRTIYRGKAPLPFPEELVTWMPSQSDHSPDDALRTARSLAGTEGEVIMVTDHLIESLPYGASLLAVGAPVNNVGFAGMSVDESGAEALWMVTVRNYGADGQTRSYTVGSGAARSEPRQIDLKPGETRLLKGPFPEKADRITVSLTPDEFSLDDELPILLPEPKTITVRQTGAASASTLTNSLIEALPAILPAAPDAVADLTITTYNPLNPANPPDTAIILLHQEAVPQNYQSGPVVAENHPLNEQLNWQGLIVRTTPSMPIDPADQPLVWQGSRPLLLLREHQGRRQLLCNFDVVHSNASRLPAFIILVNRFVDRIRNGTVGFEKRNIDLHQRIALTIDLSDSAPPLGLRTKGGLQTIPVGQSGLLRAPASPGFFSIIQGEKNLLEAAAAFGDTREADFSRAASSPPPASVTRDASLHDSYRDPWWQLWVLLGIILALLSWHFHERRSESAISPNQAS
jgi:Aerotolerance regulator N-terminal